MPRARSVERSLPHLETGKQPPKIYKYLLMKLQLSCVRLAHFPVCFANVALLQLAGVSLKRSASLTTKNAYCFLWFQIIRRHFLGEGPGSNYPDAQDTARHRKASVFEWANKQGYHKWWHMCRAPFTGDVHPLRKGESIFVQIRSTSDNDALLSRSHKLGIHQLDYWLPRGTHSC